jgi:hypothetical protein
MLGTPGHSAFAFSPRRLLSLSSSRLLLLPPLYILPSTSCLPKQQKRQREGRTRHQTARRLLLQPSRRVASESASQARRSKSSVRRCSCSLLTRYLTATAVKNKADELQATATKAKKKAKKGAAKAADGADYAEGASDAAPGLIPSSHTCCRRF